MNALREFDGEYIAVFNGQVVAHGANVWSVKEEAHRQGRSAPFLTRIEDGKHIDVYEISSRFEVRTVDEEQDP